MSDNALSDFVQELADEPCQYGDNCPTFGSNHGRCLSCKARSAIEGHKALACDYNRLRGALEVIYKATRDDQHEEWWTLRSWLDQHDVFHGDIGGGHRLISFVCKTALGDTDA